MYPSYTPNPTTMNPSYPSYQYQHYQNPYLDRLTALQGQQTNASPQRSEIIRVNGKGGADAFPMPPNSSVLLLDETAPVVWLKQTDGAGFPTCTPYSITPYQAPPEPDYASLDDRISKLEAMVSVKPDPSANEPKHKTENVK